MAKLSAVGINALGPGKHPDGDGLYLQVTEGSKGTNRSWLYRYFVDGKERQMGLGKFPAVSLKKAREIAADHREERRKGLDPLRQKEPRAKAARLEEGLARTFDQVADEYIALQKPGWRNPKHAAQYTNTLRTYASPTIGKLPVGEVTTALVLDVLKPIWAKKAETAQRVRQRIESVLDYAKFIGIRTGENPASWRGNLAHTLPPKSRVAKVKHHAALDWRKMPEFMKRLALQKGNGARALEFVIFTAARSGEVRGARWKEIDGEVWTVPAERMKAGREHKVPLSPGALKVLERMRTIEVEGERMLLTPNPEALIFPGQRRDQSLSDMSLTAVLRRMKVEVTAHGFRSSFRDWAAETTDHQRDVVEMALSHAVESRVEAAYRRGALLEKRRLLMEDWDRFL